MTKLSETEYDVKTYETRIYKDAKAYVCHCAVEALEKLKIDKDLIEKFKNEMRVHNGK